MARKRKARTRVLVMVIIIIVFIIGSAKGITMIKNLMGRGEMEFSKLGVIQYDRSENTDIQAYGNNVAVYSDGTLTVYNDQGTALWEIKQPIERPKLVSSEQLLFLGDKEKGNIFCFDTLGNPIWTVESGQKIEDMVSNQGFVVMWSKGEEQGSTIFIYDVSGKQKGTIKLGKGDIIDGAISKDGSVVALSVLDIENDKIETNVILYGADGKLLGGNKYDNQVIPKLFFHEDNRLFNVGDHKLIGFDKSKGLLWSKEMDASLNRVSWNEEGFVVLSLVNNKNMIMDTKNRNYLMMMNMDGQEIGRVPMKAEVLGVDTKGKNITAYTKRTLYFFTKTGKELGEKKVNSDIHGVHMLTEDRMVLVLNNKLEITKVKYKN
ncbi:MAG: PQQ-like beta-propeller repeat protein [Anaerosolibacter sp.]|uniref:DUF5711 family protein n=1 Tax=Anaerosolibacter sp. TaxID=1872527 RepID=UPI0026186EB4|nr:DUF5711 family protein [Anaerosolibacter sp.]MDF2548607.1 PQQ-like beta-propeller repeat protein [Anaerosolibacter sp.]